MRRSKVVCELSEYAQTLGYRAQGTRDGVRFVHSIKRIPIVTVHPSPSDLRSEKAARADLLRGVRQLRCVRKDCPRLVPERAAMAGDEFCSRVCFEEVTGIRAAKSLRSNLMGLIGGGIR